MTVILIEGSIINDKQRANHLHLCHVLLMHFQEGERVFDMHLLDRLLQLG